MSKSNPFLDPEHPVYGSVTPKSAYEAHMEGERRKALEEKINGKKNHDVQDSVKDQAQVIVQPVVQGISLDKLVVEASALRSQAGGNKDLLSYDNSLASLKSRGYDRHLRFDEVFKIMIDALENPNGKWKSVDADLRSSYGEWLSAYFQVSPDGKELTVFLDPENLQWNGSIYVVNGNNGIVKGSNMHKFSLEKVLGKGILRGAKTKNISLKTWVPISQINEVSPELVEFLYTRHYDRLPDRIKNNAHLWLPENGKGWPVGRGFVSGSYSLSAGYVNRASRGVRT